MKREIKFRGKRIDTGEWIYGNVHIPNKLFSNTLICPDTTYGDVAPGMGDDDDFNEVKKWGCAVGHYHRVITESVGQFTGLLDKNGVEIYEGDICQAMQGEQQKPGSFYQVKSSVTFWRGSFEFFGKSLNKVNIDSNRNAQSIMWCWHGHNNLPDIYEEINSIEVIGNIYSNPELL